MFFIVLYFNCLCYAHEKFIHLLIICMTIFYNVIRILLFLSITNCAYSPEIYVPFHFASPLTMNVSRVEFVNNTSNYEDIADATGELPYKLTDVARDWINDKFIPRGNDEYIMRVTVEEASLKLQELPAPAGIKYFFTSYESELYTTDLNLKFEIFEPGHYTPVAHMQIRASEQSTILESDSLEKIRRIFYYMSEKLIHEVDAQFNQKHDQYFNKFIL